jgi:hypothetical protein
MTWLVLVFVSLFWFVAGYVVCLVATRTRMWMLESEFRVLAIGVFEYTLLSGEETLPAEWVQEQLNGFIRKEFG